MDRNQGGGSSTWDPSTYHHLKMVNSHPALSLPKPLGLPLAPDALDLINSYLKDLTPEEILKWAISYVPGLYQTTAFGLTGLVAIDMLSKITSTPPPLIFLDTLYHFPETYALVEEVKQRYCVPVHVYKPEGCATVQDFERKHGERLWENDEDTYDYAVKACCSGHLQSPDLGLNTCCVFR